MTVKDKYIELYRTCPAGTRPEMGGHYQTHIEFGGDSVYVNPDGTDVVRYVFNVDGCRKTKEIRDKKGKVVKRLVFHKDRLPVPGTVSDNDRFKRFIYKYVLFLRCDSIEDSHLILMYVLKLMCDKMEFRRQRRTLTNGLNGSIDVKYGKWEEYVPEYEDVEKTLAGIMDSAMKKDIDDATREQFIVRTSCVVNPEGTGHRKKTRNERLRDSRIGTGRETDNRIRNCYDKNLTDKENADKAGVSLRRFKDWKKDNVESPEDRIKRLYDRSRSVKENAVICGVSESSIHRYKRTLPEEAETDWIDDMLKEMDF